MTKKVSKKSKRRLMTFGIISILSIGYFCFTLIGYIYNYINLKKEETNLKNELLYLQDEKENLKIEIQKLNDPTYVVRYAKEKFLYSSDGEFVIKINENFENNNTSIKEDNKAKIIISIIMLLILILTIIRLKPYKLLRRKKI